MFREAGALGAATFLLLFGGMIASALLEPVCLALVALRVATSFEAVSAEGAGQSALLSFFLTSLVFGHIVAGLIGVAGLHRLGQTMQWRTLALLPVYWLLVSVAAWRALYQLVADPDRWEKTEHRLARMPSPPP